MRRLRTRDFQPFVQGHRVNNLEELGLGPGLLQGSAFSGQNLYGFYVPKLYLRTSGAKVFPNPYGKWPKNPIKCSESFLCQNNVVKGRSKARFYKMGWWASQSGDLSNLWTFPDEQVRVFQARLMPACTVWLKNSAWTFLLYPIYSK